MRLTEKEIIELFRNSFDKYGPLTITNFKEEVPFAKGLRADAQIEFSISDGPSFEALAEIKSIATPKTILEAARLLGELLRKADNTNFVPMLITPYIGTKQAKTLEQERISWIDLSGNMVIRALNKVYIERTGNRNRYPDTTPIKKVFEGTSSLVSRALLLNPGGFSSLYEIVDFIKKRDGNVTLSTVSKVLKSLEEGLLITKSKTCISVTNREKLLENLTEGYVNYVNRRPSRTYKFAVENISELFTMFYENKVDYAACGFYAAKLKGLATTDRFTVFISSIAEAKKAFELNLMNIRPDTEFGQLDLIETKNPCVWFNVQRKPFDNIVDEIELYLELMVDTPRGPKIAEVLRDRILSGDING